VKEFGESRVGEDKDKDLLIAIEGRVKVGLTGL